MITQGYPLSYRMSLNMNSWRSQYDVELEVHRCKVDDCCHHERRWSAVSTNSSVRNCFDVLFRDLNLGLYKVCTPSETGRNP